MVGARYSTLGSIYYGTEAVSMLCSDSSLIVFILSILSGHWVWCLGLVLPSISMLLVESMGLIN